MLQRRDDVHLPVPFWPAVSRITSTMGLPCLIRKPRISRVISIRYESSLPSFHSAKISCISSGTGPALLHRWYDSPMSCISPYSMPLWTILTKCPAPFAPTQSQHGVSPSTLAETAWKIGLTSGQASGGPPGMIEGPGAHHLRHPKRRCRYSAALGLTSRCDVSCP